MFDHFLVSVVIIPPLLVLAVRLIADRLTPQTAAVAVTWSAAGAALAGLLNVLVFALKAVAEIPAVGLLFGWSARIVRADTGHVPWVSWLSVALLAAIGVRVIVVHRRQHRLLALAGIGAAPAGHVQVVPDDVPRAFAVPGDPGHVVVTTGMRELLSPEQFEALLAHEHAHLAARHHRLIQLSELAAAAHPALWWVARHVDYLVERAADEYAATRIGCRRTLARAIGTAALAASAASPAGPGLHAASPGGVVPRRVARLLKPRAGRGAAILYLAPIGLAVFSLAWTAEAAYDLGELIHAAWDRP
ncbi:M56 family metallopeptidase [Actinoplanes sp. L3-i22]|uniref:M56 family metallopeptidase n=1 Tax=Actinoplanes sp. L3-i22 TaxID=2836373 RepID=UPI001C75C0C9|nr:M56 family metallopeptidase [Actinoplanes sp. L3-i22]BCY11528.1 membrane protein [Actinoplanes sp. L3-i22]